MIGLRKDNFLASFLLGWSITTGAGLASYPIAAEQEVNLLVVPYHLVADSSTQASLPIYSYAP